MVLNCCQLKLHTVFLCPRCSHQRIALEEELGRVLTVKTLVTEMTENIEKWDAITIYLTYIIKRKEEYERQWKRKLKRSWLVKNTTSIKLPSHLEEMPKGGLKAIGNGTKEGVFLLESPHDTILRTQCEVQKVFSPHDKKIKTQTNGYFIYVYI